MEINNQEVMTLNNFVQKQKIVEDEKGIYSSISAFGESKKGQEDNKKEQPIQSSVVQFPTQDNSYGQDSVWLPL